ncbi:hypothetical protein EYR27_17260 [Xanthomonas oryzae]|nr:hypothetical protein EYR27_17260 [Xanthomonas oryzae]
MRATTTQPPRQGTSEQRVALRANLGFRLIATATHAGNQWLATYGDCPRYESDAGERGVHRFLRARPAPPLRPRRWPGAPLPNAAQDRRADGAARRPG